jgi:RHS repeat-associated protein
LVLTERNTYGSSRVGLEQVGLEMEYVEYNPQLPLPSPYFASDEIGDKRYQLSNHLGNVLEVVTDMKLAEDDGTYYENDIFISTTLDNKVDYYTADVVSYSDYYPYGMVMPNRHGEVGDGYRYGYQGSEKDDEVKGNGNSYTTTYRQHDPRVARWLSIDPKQSGWESPYASMGNNPIFYMDPLGDTINYINDPESQAMKVRIQEMRGKSVIFNALIEKLESDSKVIDVKVDGALLDKMSSKPNGINMVRPGTDRENLASTVVLRVTNDDEVIVEEIFHAYQRILYDGATPEGKGDGLLKRTFAQIESEANLMQALVEGELGGSLSSLRGNIQSFSANDKLFIALKENDYVVTPGSEASKLYNEYLDYEELFTKGTVYQGDQPHIVPIATNKIVSSSGIDGSKDISAPKNPYVVVGKKKKNE